MGDYAALIKFIVGVLFSILVISGAIYMTHLHDESNMNKERIEYRSTIAKEVIAKETIAKEKKEHKAVEAFKKVEAAINKESNTTRTYTKENLHNENITDFTDTF